MRNSFRLAFLVPVLACSCGLVSPSQAQETLAGVGAATAMGAGLGAAAANMSAKRVTRNVGAGGTNEMPNQGTDPTFPSPGAAGVTTTTTTTTITASAPLAGASGGGASILGQLMAVPNQPTPTRVRRSPRAQAAYSRRVTRMSPTARKKLVLQKYKIPAVGYLASYLPADRYKFAKAWKYVSTETDRFYYRPQDMARHRFNANRVIGFRTWQEAMLAGYRPDPISKPEPGNQLAYIANLTTDEPLVRYIEYVYSGQVSPATFDTTYNYVRSIRQVVMRTPRALPYQRETINRVLEASLTGNAGSIPTTFGPADSGVITNAAGQSATGGSMSPQSLEQGEGKLDKREGEFNQFGRNAGKLANVPANR